ALPYHDAAPISLKLGVSGLRTRRSAVGAAGAGRGAVQAARRKEQLARDAARSEVMARMDCSSPVKSRFEIVLLCRLRLPCQSRFFPRNPQRPAAFPKPAIWAAPAAVTPPWWRG